jgi:hypothetical protein
VSKKPQNKRALNPVKHGAMAGILPHERTAWKRHLEAVRAELQPVGPVEEALVERIALALWRLRRVAAWEAGLLADARDRARETYGLGDYLLPDSPPNHRQAAAVNLLRQTMKHWPITPLAKSFEVAEVARGYVASERERIADLERALAALDDPAQLAALDDDAAGMAAIALIDALDEQEKAALAARWEIEPEEIGEIELTAEDFPILLELLGIERTRAALERELHSTRQNVALVEQALEIYHQATAERQARARPDLDELAKLQRYEAHLERMLYRALHELQALQARRRGEAAPLGRIEVYGLDESPLPARCDGAE